MQSREGQFDSLLTRP
nr:unnamed protein product [Callosobruchus chinensis]